DDDSVPHVVHCRSADAVKVFPGCTRSVMAPLAGLEVHEVKVDKLALAVTMIGDVAVAIVPLVRLRAVERAVEPGAWEKRRGVPLLEKDPSATVARKGASQRIRDVPMELLIEPVEHRH